MSEKQTNRNENIKPSYASPQTYPLSQNTLIYKEMVKFDVKQKKCP